MGGSSDEFIAESEYDVDGIPKKRKFEAKCAFSAQLYLG